MKMDYIEHAVQQSNIPIIEASVKWCANSYNYSLPIFFPEATMKIPKMSRNFI
jgi:hypothetical protein